MIHSDAAGENSSKKFVFYGEFLEVDKPRKISQTFIYDAYADTVITETVTFEPAGDGQTNLQTISSFPSLEALEGMVNSGMQWGATESWDRLSELIA